MFYKNMEKNVPKNPNQNVSRSLFFYLSRPLLLLAMVFSTTIHAVPEFISNSVNRSQGEYFYSAIGRATLGQDMLAVVMGQVAIPPEGLIVTASPAGRMEGRINGTFIAREWARIYPDFNMDIYVHTTIETDDGYLIAFDYTGTNNPDANGETNTISTFGTFSTSAEPYLWVNEVTIAGLGSVDRASGQFRVDYNEVVNNIPFGLDNFDSQINMLSGLESSQMLSHLLESPFAKHIYSTSIQLTGAETFGVSYEDISNGTAYVPPQGLRMNSLLVGQAEGMMTGSMSGVDFLTINPDGTRNPDVRVLLETDDGAEIQAHYEGILIPDENGEPIARVFLKAHHSTPAESYQWIHNQSLIGIGILDLQTYQLNFDFYELEVLK